MQQTSLNGAQVASMVEIVSKVATGELPRESGVNIILTSFPVTPEDAERIMGDAGQSFVPSSQNRVA